MKFSRSNAFELARRSFLSAFGLVCLAGCSLTIGLDEQELPNCLDQANGDLNVAHELCSVAFSGDVDGYYEGCLSHRCEAASDGAHHCVAASEVCDGNDNDCDRIIDESTIGREAELSTTESLEAAPLLVGETILWADSDERAHRSQVEAGQLMSALITRRTSERASSVRLPTDLVDGCHSGVGTRDLQEANCKAGSLVAAPATDDRVFVAGTSSFGCSGGQLHVGTLSGTNWDEPGPSQRSNTFAGVNTVFRGENLNRRDATQSCSAIDVDICAAAIAALGSNNSGDSAACTSDADCGGETCRCGRCVTSARSAFADACGLGQMGMASILSGTNPVALLSVVSGGAGESHCGETLRSVGYNLLQMRSSAGLNVIDAADEGTFAQLGKTRGTAAPATLAWGDRGFFVAFGNGEGKIALNFVSPEQVTQSGEAELSSCTPAPQECCTEEGCKNTLACDSSMIFSTGNAPTGANLCAGCPPAQDLQPCQTEDCPAGSTLCCGNRVNTYGAADACAVVVYACGQPSEGEMRECVASEPLEELARSFVIESDGTHIDSVALSVGGLHGATRNELEVALVWNAANFEVGVRRAGSVWFKRLRLRIDDTGRPAEVVSESESVRLSDSEALASHPEVIFQDSGFRQPFQGEDAGIAGDEDGGFFVLWRSTSEGTIGARLARVGEGDAAQIGDIVDVGDNIWSRLTQSTGEPQILLGRQNAVVRRSLSCSE